MQLFALIKQVILLPDNSGKNIINPAIRKTLIIDFLANITTNVVGQKVAIFDDNRDLDWLKDFFALYAPKRGLGFQ